MSKCSTIGCRNKVGSQVVRWEDYPDEPVCDECARRYAAMGATDFTVVSAS